MKSSEGALLKNGVKGSTGRSSRNKAALEIERIGEENCITLYQMQLEIAMSSPDENVRSNAQQFLLSRFLPSAKRGRRIELSLKPMNCLQDVSDNEATTLNYICDGTITLDEGEKFFTIIEQCRKTREIVDIAEEIKELKEFIRQSKQKK